MTALLELYVFPTRGAGFANGMTFRAHVASLIVAAIESRPDGMDPDEIVKRALVTTDLLIAELVK